MNIRYVILMMLVSLPLHTVQAGSPAVNTLLNEYANQGAGKPDAEKGRQLWDKTFQGKGRYPERSCASCHTRKLQQPGKHVRTNKVIEPMAPSVNPERLTQTRQIRKWFKRNCKWTLGRECTAAEKANLLVFIQSQ